MKQTYLILASFFLLGLTSCIEEVEVREKPVTEVTDLKVPADFSWKMSHDVLLSVESPVETVVEVFSSEKCEEGSLLGTLQAPIQNIPLSVADADRELYVRYTKKDGTKAVMTTGIVTRASGGLTVKLPEAEGIKEGGEKNYILYYPSREYGTLLFEDNWPVKGDYDLNDVAAHYTIQLNVEDKEVVAIIVNVKLTALGGSYPYQLCMRANNLKHNQVFVEKYETGLSFTPIGTYKVLSSNDEPLLVSFDWPNLKGSNGGAFYNTEDEHLASGSLDDHQVSFIIYMEGDEGVEPLSLPHDSFDFFIKRTDSELTEIHLKGYAPTDLFKDGYAKESQNMGDFYSTKKDNFVWGVKVPATIAHPKERVSILEAYPLFGSWVTSGGVDNPDWYSHGEKGKCVPLK